MYEIGIQYTNDLKNYRPETIFHTEIKGHNSDNNLWILSVIKLDLYFMTIYIALFKSYRPETIFHSEIKGHNSDNNRWILSVIELDLHFIIIYLCMKYESNTSMYSKDIARKPFFVRTVPVRT